MHRLSVNQFCSLRWSFFQDVVRYSNLGFQSIGLWRSKVSDVGSEEAADFLYEMQMSVSSLSWAGGFTGSEGQSFKLSVEDGLEAIYQAHEVGSDFLVVHPGGRNGHTDSHALRLFRSALHELIPAAQDLGVRLLIEPVEELRSPWNFIANFETYQELLSDFAPRDVGLVIDLFHIGRSQSFYRNFGVYRDRVQLVQLADGKFKDGRFKRCNLGDGVVAIEQWLELLAENGFEGKFEIELHGTEFEGLDYTQTIQANQKYIANSTRAQFIAV